MKILRILKNNIVIIMIFLLVIGVKFLAFDVKLVDGSSMYPTLNCKMKNDRIILNRLYRYGKNYNYEDIVVIKKNDGSGDSIIKRIIGLPGDIIEIKNGHVFRNGEKLSEDYLQEGASTWPKGTYHVSEESVFVLGDNRGGSKDSRVYGDFSYEDIIGEAVYRFNILKFNGNKL